MTNTLTITISGNAVQIIEGSLQLKSRVDDKDSCTFTVRDDSGTAAYSKGQPVVVTDSVLGKLFTGFINKPTATNLYPNATNLWSMDCVNQFYVAAKKSTQPKKRGGKHKNQPAGAIAANQIQQYLEPDGVSGNFGLDWSELQTDWQSGTLTGVAATTNTSTGNVGAGDLELNPQGTVFTYTGSTSVATNQAALHLQGYASSGYSAAYTYRTMWTGSQVITTNDAFSYEIWISSTSPSMMSGVEFVCSDGTTLTSQSVVDGYGVAIAPTTDLSGLANDQWYFRNFNMPSALNGKTLVAVQVFLAGSSAGTYDSYFRNLLYQVLSPFNAITIFGISSTLTTNVQAKNIGYTNVLLEQVNAGDKVQSAELSPGSFGVVGIVQSSQISWVENLPSGCSVVNQTSIDAAASWQNATSGSAIPNLLPGMVAGTGFNNPFLDFLSTFTLGTDPTAQPSLSDIQITINPSYSSTKTDYTKTWELNADFNTGTFTNLANNSILGEGITLNGFQRNWEDVSTYSDQTLYGTSSPSQVMTRQQFVLTTGTGTDVRSRMDPAGQWQNFTCEVDMIAYATGGGAAASLVYRCTGWQNQNNTYAYMVGISTSTIQFGYGTNSSSGGGAFTQLDAISLTLANNSLHRLKVVVNGNNHQIFLDGVLLINMNDSTYTAAGYIGLRLYNNTGSTLSATFGNFGVCAALSGTWESASTSIASPGTYGGSLVQWDTSSLPDNTTSISVQTSIDGGATFQSVQNGGAIANLTNGQSLTGKALLLLVTLTAQSAPVVPSMLGISVWVLGQYSSSGTRSTAPLAWDNMIRGNISGGFGTATNGATYTQTGTGTVALTSDEALISNTTGDVHMVPSGVPASTTDEETTLRFQLSASTMSAGVELRYADANNYFRLEATQNSLSIIIAIRGVVSTLATATPTISTSAWYRMRFRVVGSGPINFYGRVWTDGTSEPTAWSITATQ